MLITSREAVILSIVQRKKRYGMEIHTEYESKASRSMPLGSLYTTLQRMSKKKLIKSSGRKGRRKYYIATSKGLRDLKSFRVSCNSL